MAATADTGAGAADLAIVEDEAVEEAADAESEAPDNDASRDNNEYRDAEMPLAFFRPMLTTDDKGNMTFSFTAPNANTNPHPHTDANTNTNTDANSDARWWVSRGRDGQAAPAHAYSDTYAHAHTYSHSYTYSYSHTPARTHSGLSDLYRCQAQQLV